MAKGTIKTTGSQQTGITGVGITLTPPGGGPPVGSGGFGQGTGTPAGLTLTGTLQDDATGAIVNFIQPFGIELGLAVGCKVVYYTASNGTANSVRLLHKGEIQTINPTNDGGTLLDKATGNTIDFAMALCQESGLVPAGAGVKGTRVHFETIFSPYNANPTAVALEIMGG